MPRCRALIASSALLLFLAACGSGGGEGIPTELPVTPTAPLTGACSAAPAAPLAPGQPAPAIRVQGNCLVNGAGQAVRLRGVNRSGTEYACAQGWGIFDGPRNEASIVAMESWKINVVRVPMNETCWLGINGTRPEHSGASYQRAISDYVALLNRRGMVVILELHWSGPDTVLALKQAPMPDRDHTVEFWRQVASAYKGNDAVLFDLFNEPFPDGNRDTPEAWRCWKEGGTCAGVSYQAAGMQELVTAVRATGATNVILLGGVGYASRLSGWLANKPTDPLQNLAASWHVYNFSGCNSRTCWDAEAAPVALAVPLVLGELGQNDRGSAFVTSLMDWMDARRGSYLAWVWNVWGTELDLIGSYDGTPTPYGATFRARFGS